MTVLVLVAVSASAPLALLLWILWVRNDQVYRYRTTLIVKVSEAAEKDALAGAEWMWRFNEFDRVGYQRMMWQFWRSLDSFYPDKSFARP
jgi:hypothetical protein